MQDLLSAGGPPGGLRARLALPQLWARFVAAGAAAGLVYLLLPAPVRVPAAVARILLYNGVGAAATAAIVVGLQRYRPAQPLPWWLLAAAQLIYLAGNVLFCTLNSVLHKTIPYPSMADALNLARYPFMAVGVLLLVRHRSPQGDRGALIDGSIVAVGMAVLSWAFLIEPRVAATSLPLLSRLVSAAYPVMDVLILAVAARLLMGPGGTAAGRHRLHLAAAPRRLPQRQPQRPAGPGRLGRLLPAARGRRAAPVDAGPDRAGTRPAPLARLGPPRLPRRRLAAGAAADPVPGPVHRRPLRRAAGPGDRLRRAVPAGDRAHGRAVPRRRDRQGGAAARFRRPGAGRGGAAPAPRPDRAERRGGGQAHRRRTARRPHPAPHRGRLPPRRGGHHHGVGLHHRRAGAARLHPPLAVPRDQRTAPPDDQAAPAWAVGAGARPRPAGTARRAAEPQRHLLLLRR